MFLTYECGNCSSLYQIDTDDITQSGIKVTCSKCLAYIILRNKPAEQAPKPVIEKVAQLDGAYQVNFPVTSPKIEEALEIPEPFLESGTDPKLELPTGDIEIPHDEPSMKDFDLLSAGSFEQIFERPEEDKSDMLPPDLEIPAPEAPQKNVETGKIHATHSSLTSADLLSYPEISPPEGKFDSLLIPISLISIVIAGLIFLNYKGIILIPGLENVREEVIHAQPTPTPVPTAIATPQANYGFPVIEDTPAEVTPAPSSGTGP